jgi:CBS domain-containing protein
MKTVGEIVRGRKRIDVEARSPVLETARTMAEHRVGAFPVLDGERLAGVFSEQDLMTRVVVAGRDPQKVSTDEVMTRDLVVAAPEDGYESATAKMIQRGCRHIPIVASDRLLGFLSLRDLLQVEIDEQAESLAMMNHYVHYYPPDVEKGFRDSVS